MPEEPECCGTGQPAKFSGQEPRTQPQKPRTTKQSRASLFNDLSPTSAWDSRLCTCIQLYHRSVWRAIAMSEKLEKDLEDAEANEQLDTEQAINVYRTIIASPVGEESVDDINRIKENTIYKLASLLAKLGRVQELSQLLKDIRPFADAISKAKTAKIVRTLIDMVALIPNTTSVQIELCNDSVAWANETKRTFLRQRIETRLAALHLEAKQYQTALNLISALARQVKKLDDKLLLVEIHLIESRIQHALRNLPKAKAALTAARTNANAIYCPPALQTQLDMQAGVLHADDNDYKTAYSYFFETFEGLSTLNDPSAVLALKYMLLSKIMTHNTEDVDQIIQGKTALRYAGREVEAMRAVAGAHHKRSLHDFELALANYNQELKQDAIIEAHLSALYDKLLEQNLTRIVEPFSKVEIGHVAELIMLPVHDVETKLSQMILDKKLNGILDQGAGLLIVFDEVVEDKTYTASLGTIKNMGKVVDALFEKARGVA
eukprot:TRINITY_DN6818_c0_g1_i2.p1 TRINITY_DN6818_c0_g1~~TRINITY_DN6818_c0_g1_i2.p1  ORF type:complete len:491 (-),score=91.88 TRINITY_DN6818_c0_g1_i2:202-1674(-)